MYTLDCSYYNNSFDTLEELIQDIIYRGMDPSYNILKDNKKTGEKLEDFLVF